MRRRQFIAGLAIATFWPVAARAQQSPGQMRRVGMLWANPEQLPGLMKRQAAFLDRMRELGYIDGKTIQIHARYAGGVLDRLPGLARELVAVPVVNQIRTYWWCSPPRTGRQRMVPVSLTARETGASFSKDKCVLISL